MPFGISSAPEIWQRNMHETVEGLDDTEIIPYDFLITGKDDAKHDANLQALLNRFRERNRVLHAEKVRYKPYEVSFMGCLLTDQGMKPDPRKVEAVLDMPMPTDVERVRRLIGKVQCPGKFVKGLTDLDVNWHARTASWRGMSRTQKPCVRYTWRSVTPLCCVTTRLKA